MSNYETPTIETLAGGGIRANTDYFISQHVTAFVKLPAFGKFVGSAIIISAPVGIIAICPEERPFENRLC